MPLNLFNSISSLPSGARESKLWIIINIVIAGFVANLLSWFLPKRHYDNDFYHEQDCRQYRISGRSSTIEPSIFHSPIYQNSFFLHSPHCLLFDYIDSSWFLLWTDLNVETKTNKHRNAINCTAVDSIIKNIDWLKTIPIFLISHWKIFHIERFQ